MALGRIAMQRGSWDRALQTTRRALELAERYRLRVEEHNCHEMLASIYEHMGDFRASLHHHRRFHALKEARLNDQTQSRLANLRVMHQVETARKDAEIQRLRSLALEQEVTERRVAQARLEAEASLDPLTGLFNRSHLTVLAAALRSAVNRGLPASLMMFDIDHFKLINDTHGHLAGDRVLVSIARELSHNARKTDVPCRYGGDEFLVLLADMDSYAAQGVAERLREAVSTTPVPSGEKQIAVTISVGVASLGSGEPADLDSLLERVDAALYAAKVAGRDRVEVAAPTVR
jgi:diguanylate cyclase (GGDEF)-like protein